ncbi:hypothetical protein EVAR_45952_1 [Eumeta japonica]|uniref:Uncharacterized protein n=1 Tax=Eumeta variegata TaxID=151549 RepID=A0A4C1YQ74_EUMVA|nr:hypothetical protein EVAR_45952_1 [Eumeta japonica]
MIGNERWVRPKKNGSRSDAVEVRPLLNMCGVYVKDSCRDSDVRERCDLKEDVATRVERNLNIGVSLRDHSCTDGEPTWSGCRRRRRARALAYLPTLRIAANISNNSFTLREK